MEDLSGRTFGAYRIIGPLGSGGMASVYRAYQPAVDREVALKILPRHLAQDPEFVARFRQEAQILAKLQHPYILPAHDFGDADGFTYIVMPFIETGTLAASLTGQPLPIDAVVRVISQVGDALDCAHAEGLVHRDVKPSNILIDNRGNCLLSDFGIAKILEGADTLTATGGLVGTPKYMSPEQGMAQEIDGRSDIYSLGVVLYEMATGRVPFDADTPVAVVVKHIHDPLPMPRQLNPELSDRLERVILRALHKEPAQRFETAGAMVDELSALQDPTIAAAEAPTLPLPLPSGTAPNAPASTPTPVQNADVPETEPLARPVSTPVDVAPTIPVRQAPSTGGRPVFAIGALATVVVLLLWFGVFSREGTDGDDAMTAVETAATAPATDAASATADATPDTAPPSTEPSPVPVETVADAAPPPPTTAPARSEAPREPEPTENAPPVSPLGSEPDVALAGAPAPARDTNEAVLTALARAEEARLAREADAAAADPFPDVGDGTFLDRQFGARWTVQSEPARGTDGLLWTEANDHCNRLSLGARADWRLPSQLELDTLLQRLPPDRYPWGLTLWSADREPGNPNRLWVSSSPLYAPAWSTAVRDNTGRRLTHRAVCVTGP